MPIRLGDLRTDTKNVRKSFAKSGIKSLADTIENNGVLQNLVVRESPTEEGAYILICGERRFRALKHLAKQGVTVPFGGDSRVCDDDFPVACSIIDEANANNSQVINLVENTAREDVFSWDLGQAYLELQDDHCMTQADIAKMVGKTPQHVNALTVIARQTHPEVLKKLKLLGKGAPGNIELLKIARALDASGRPDKGRQLELLANMFTQLTHRTNRKPTLAKQLKRLSQMSVTLEAEPYVEAVVMYLKAEHRKFKYEQPK